MRDLTEELEERASVLAAEAEQLSERLVAVREDLRQVRRALSAVLPRSARPGRAPAGPVRGGTIKEVILSELRAVGRPLTTAELADRIRKPRETVSPQVTRLVAEGRLRRADEGGYAEAVDRDGSGT